MTRVLLAMQSRLSVAVDYAPISRGRLEQVIARLWSPLEDPVWRVQAGAGALVFAARLASAGGSALGRRLAYAAGAVAGCLSRLDARRPARSLRRGRHGAGRGGAEWAARLLGRAALVRPASAKALCAPAPLPRRAGPSGVDYRLMAREILAHPDWVAVAGLPEPARRRVLTRLVDKTLGAGCSVSADVAARAASLRVPTAA